MSATGQGGSTGTGYDGSRIKPGTRLNGVYEIERLIARGGMGEVYAGRAVETDVPVAIKMIRPELSADPAIIGLFRREAMALHQLRHETIVGYYLFSIDPELQCAYLAMEFVPGRSLADIVHAQGPLGFDAVRILQKRLASGLQAAHTLGIVHRDVSSDNIIMPEGDPARARIIDFGIAKNTLNGSTIIGDGFAGKNNYISPEQVGLFGGKVTAKSDVYSLGLVLTEALLGRPLDMGGSLADVVVKREVVPDLTGVDQRMLPLIRGMLDPDPETRLSMAEVAEHEAGTARHALPPREATVVKQQTRRHPGVLTPQPEPQSGRRLPLVAVGSAAGAAIVAVAAFLLWPSGRTEQTAQTGRGAPTLSQSEQPSADQQAAARQQEQARKAREEAEAAERRATQERLAREEQARQQAQAEEAQRRAEADRVAQERQRQDAEEQRRRQAEAAAAAEQQLAQERARREEQARQQAQAEEAQRRAEAERAAQERQRQEADERRRQAEAAEQRRLAEERARREQEAEEQRRRQAEAAAAAEQQRLAREEQARQQQAQAEEQRRRQAEVAAADLRMAMERAERDERLRREREEEERRQREAEAAAGQKPQVAARTDAPAQRANLIQDCSQCPDLLPIPGGMATVGSTRDPSERPPRTVPVKPFLMSRVPVTVGQWRECFLAGGCSYEAKGDDRAPVNNVSFDDAQQYIAWLSKATRRDYRLPSEVEWEYAARAGATTRYWWGDEFSADYANCRKCGPTRLEPFPTGAFRPNAFGLQDMTGSIGQWMADCWHKDYRGAPKDASAWASGRCREQVVRGGAWSSEPADQTVSSRSFYDPGVRHPSYGFRVVRSP